MDFLIGEGHDIGDGLIDGFGLCFRRLHQSGNVVKCQPDSIRSKDRSKNADGGLSYNAGSKKRAYEWG
jgi:hypothetical protein